MDIKVLVATHKEYWMPEDEAYLPLHVGREGKRDLGFVGDNTGENISAKNSNFCELTGLYWGWKNLTCDYMGLCHYRRYFAHPIFKYDIETKRTSIYSKKEIEKVLKKYDVVLPHYHILKNSTVRAAYERDHIKRDLDETENVLIKFFPEYINDFNFVMNQEKIYFCNMFIMRKELVDSYCTWLFKILFELEKRIDISSYDVYQARIYGFLSERLFNVWLHHQKLKVFLVKPVLLENDSGGNIIKRALRYGYYKLYELFQ